MINNKFIIKNTYKIELKCARMQAYTVAQRSKGRLGVAYYPKSGRGLFAKEPIKSGERVSHEKGIPIGGGLGLPAIILALSYITKLIDLSILATPRLDKATSDLLLGYFPEKIIQMAAAVRNNALGIPGGYALGAVFSLFNHSCRANAAVFIDLHKGCATCGNVAAKLKCSKCSTTIYCNRDCQKADWKIHKPQCGSNIAISKPYISVVAMRDINEGEQVTVKYGNCSDLINWGFECTEGIGETPCGVNQHINSEDMTTLKKCRSYAGEIKTANFYHLPYIKTERHLAELYAAAKHASCDTELTEASINDAEKWLNSLPQAVRDDVFYHSGFCP